MEVTAYCLFSVFAYLAFFINYTREEKISQQSILFRLTLGIIFIVLAVMSMKIDIYYIIGGNLTNHPEDLITNTWQKGLFLIYILIGFGEIAYTIMDGLDYRRKKQEEEE